MSLNTRTGARFTTARKRVQTTFTRPSDTTAYAAGDQVANSTSAPTILTLSNVANRPGGTGKIVDVILETDLATVTNGTFRIYFFSLSFTPNNDNAAFAKLHANGAYLQGYVDMPILAADSASAAAAASRVNQYLSSGDDGIPLHFQCEATDDNLYAVIVATGAYTPKSGGVFRLSVVAELDA